MSETNQTTLDSYNSHVQEYIDGTLQEVSGHVKEWIDGTLASLPANAVLLHLTPEETRIVTAKVHDGLKAGG